MSQYIISKDRPCVCPVSYTHLDVYKRQAWDKYMNEVPLKDGVGEYLDWCLSKDIRLGIATSNSRELVNSIARVHGLEPVSYTPLRMFLPGKRLSMIMHRMRSLIFEVDSGGQRVGAGSA